MLVSEGGEQQVRASVRLSQFLQGGPNIIQKLTGLPFQKCQHHISSTDAQPSLSGGIMVFVTGQLMARLFLMYNSEFTEACERDMLTVFIACLPIS